MEAETLVDTLADTLEQAEAERLNNTLGDVEMATLIDKMADTLVGRKARTLLETLGGVWRQRNSFTLWLTQ